MCESRPFSSLRRSTEASLMYLLRIKTAQNRSCRCQKQRFRRLRIGGFGIFLRRTQMLVLVLPHLRPTNRCKPQENFISVIYHLPHRSNGNELEHCNSKYPSMFRQCLPALPLILNGRPSYCFSVLFLR